MAEGDDKLEEELRKRWDPDRLAKFLKLREGRSQRLDLSTRSKYERRLGVDLGDVRIFSGELAEEITKAHGAEALTVGSTGMVLLGNQTKYSPGTAAGQALLAHELTHVAQAKPSTIQRKGVSDAPLATEESELEAEAVEAEVYQEQAGAAERGPSEAQDDKKKRERREQLRERVLALFEQEQRLGLQRRGF